MANPSYLNNHYLPYKTTKKKGHYYLMRNESFFRSDIVAGTTGPMSILTLY